LAKSERFLFFHAADFCVKTSVCLIDFGYWVDSQNQLDNASGAAKNTSIATKLGAMMENTPMINKNCSFALKT
jgi:hypothetical protein